jgi:hypothetical protein
MTHSRIMKKEKERERGERNKEPKPAEPVFKAFLI